LAEALLNPPEPTPRPLKKAFRRRRELIGFRMTSALFVWRPAPPRNTSALYFAAVKTRLNSYFQKDRKFTQDIRRHHRELFLSAVEACHQPILPPGCTIFGGEYFPWLTFPPDENQAFAALSNSGPPSASGDWPWTRGFRVRGSGASRFLADCPRGRVVEGRTPPLFTLLVDAKKTISPVAFYQRFGFRIPGQSAPEHYSFPSRPHRKGRFR